MAVLKLTKRETDRLQPQAKAYVVYDSDMKGFGLRVMPSGSKTWIVEYRPNGGGRSVGKRRMSLGSAFSVTPEQARQQAKQILGKVAAGDDPAHDRNTRRKELKVRDLIDLFEKEKPLGRRTGQPLKQRTLDNMLARLRHHVVPILGTKLIPEVTTDDVTRFIRKVSAGETSKTAKGKPRGVIKVKGGDGAARKVASDLSMLFSFAINKKIVAVNPVIAATKPKAGKRHDYLKPEQMGRIGSALIQMEANGSNPMGIAILRLILLTGSRPVEIEGLKWTEVDNHARCLRLGESKTGYSVRPLSVEALDMILAQPQIEGSPYVFPSSRGGGYYTNSKKLWNEARNLAGLKDMVRYHARHAVGTLSLSAGQSAPSVAALLGHKSPRTTMSTYAHVVDDLAMKAAEDIGGVVSAALRSGSSKVIPFKKV